jgi:hypothetical protein
LGAGIVRLLEPRANGTRIIDGLEPADHALITELARLDGPAQTTARTATQKQLIAGKEQADKRSGCQL